MNYQDEPTKGFISTQLHGIFDCFVGPLLIASPWLFGFSNVGNSAALFIPIFFGVLTSVMTIFTKYEISPIKMFPLQLHLILDMIAGFMLFVLPFLYDFYHEVWLPHVLFGLFMMGSALFTRNSPFLGRFYVLDSRGL